MHGQVASGAQPIGEPLSTRCAGNALACVQVPPKVLGGAEQARTAEQQGQPPDNGVAWQAELIYLEVQPQSKTAAHARFPSRQ